MTFKKRYVEEAIDWRGLGDRVQSGFNTVKEKASTNPGLAAGLGGAGLGLLYNYASGGADDLARDRTEDLIKFRQEEAPQQIAQDQQTIPKNLWVDTAQKIKDINHPGIWQGIKNGLWDSSNIKYNELIQARLEHPELNSGEFTPPSKAQVAYAVPGFSPLFTPNTSTEGIMGRVGDTIVDPNLSGEENYIKHMSNTANAIKSSDVAINRGIESNQDLNKEQQEYIDDIANAKRDSYLHKAAAGAALGAGGTFAARKLKERQGQ